MDIFNKITTNSLLLCRKWLALFTAWHLMEKTRYWQTSLFKMSLFGCTVNRYNRLLLYYIPDCSKITPVVTTEILGILTTCLERIIAGSFMKKQVGKPTLNKDTEGVCVAKSPVRRASGRNQHRQRLPLHQLTRWNQINPQGIALPPGIRRHKRRAMHITALVWERAQTKAPNRWRKKASGAAATKQMLFLCLLPPPFQVPAKQGAVIWSVFGCSIQPWEVSKPSDLIRAARVPQGWVTDRPANHAAESLHQASIKPWLLTWHKERREATAAERPIRTARPCAPCTAASERADRIPSHLANKTAQSCSVRLLLKRYGTG